MTSPSPGGQVLVVGSLNADLTVRTERFPGPGETVTGSDLVISPGGKGGNQAAAAGLLGGDVRLFGNVGDDANGTMLAERQRQAGVDVSRLNVLPGVASGCALITVDANGENSIIVSPGANALLTPDDVTGAEDFFEVGAGSVLTLCLEVALETVQAAAALAREKGVQVVLNLSPYRKVGPELLELTDVLLVNAHELADLTGQTEAAADGDWADVVTATRSAIGERAPGRVVVTLGADGARTFDLASGEVSDRIPSPKIDPVDTTGCGDAFLASLALRLAEGDDLQDAVAFAVRVGAYAATGMGAQDSYPTADDLAAWNP